MKALAVFFVFVLINVLVNIIAPQPCLSDNGKHFSGCTIVDGKEVWEKKGD